VVYEQRVTGVVKTSAHEHWLGVSYTWQAKHGGTYGVLKETYRDSRWSSMHKRSRKQVELTYKTACAGSSGLRQERFQSACDNPELF